LPGTVPMAVPAVVFAVPPPMAVAVGAYTSYGQAVVMAQPMPGQLGQQGQQGQQGLVIHEARYGWSTDIWGPSACSYDNGCRDVTHIVRRDVQNDEVHINPARQGQYMNEHFWPETAGGPPIPRRLAVKYSYDGGPMLMAQTKAVPNETVALHLTRLS
jgi:hypothetical protein